MRSRCSWNIFSAPGTQSAAEGVGEGRRRRRRRRQKSVREKEE